MGVSVPIRQGGYIGVYANRHIDVGSCGLCWTKTKARTRGIGTGTTVVVAVTLGVEVCRSGNRDGEQEQEDGNGTAAKGRDGLTSEGESKVSGDQEDREYVRMRCVGLSKMSKYLECQCIHTIRLRSFLDLHLRTERIFCVFERQAV